MYQESGGVEGGDGYWVKDLRLLQSIQLFFPIAKNTFSEGILPGVKLQDLYSAQDFVHKLNASVHVLHLDLLRAANRCKLRIMQAYLFTRPDRNQYGRVSILWMLKTRLIKTFQFYNKAKSCGFSHVHNIRESKGRLSTCSCFKSFVGMNLSRHSTNIIMEIWLNGTI